MGTRERERDLELLIPVAGISENGGSKSSSADPSPTGISTHYHSGQEVSSPKSFFFFLNNSEF